MNTLLKVGKGVELRDHSQIITLNKNGELKHNCALGGYYANDVLILISTDCKFPTEAKLNGDTDSYAYAHYNDALVFSTTKQEYFFVNQDYLRQEETKEVLQDKYAVIDTVTGETERFTSNSIVTLEQAKKLC